jgi:glycosyltransferase involved in cell wall biosynthesis
MVGAHWLAGTWRKRIATYIAVSESAREKFIAGGLPAEKIVVKPNFIDPAPAIGAGAGGYALYVGRLSPEKGIATMLEAWQTAHAIPLKVVGQGPLEELVAAAGRAGQGVEYLGSKALEDVFELMRRAEFLVFPSEWHETMGRTIMEAFAVGTPVVAACIGPPASMVVAEKNGFLFTPGNAAELRERVEWCSNNLACLRGMRANARRAFEARYTGEANAEMLLSIYRGAQERQAG